VEIFSRFGDFWTQKTPESHHSKTGVKSRETFLIQFDDLFGAVMFTGRGIG